MKTKIRDFGFLDIDSHGLHRGTFFLSVYRRENELAHIFSEQNINQVQLYPDYSI